MPQNPSPLLLTVVICLYDFKLTGCVIKPIQIQLPSLNETTDTTHVKTVVITVKHIQVVE